MTVLQKAYIKTTDNTLNKLLQYQDFQYRNFYNNKRYKCMKSDSNHPARLYGTVKIHKLENLEETTVVNLKL